MRILIADDHSVVRQGLKTILAESFRDAEFGEAGNGAEVLTEVRRQEWDVVVLDISMPGRSGLEVLKELRMSRPKLPVLVLSMHPEDQYAVRVLKAGAAGYLTKESAPVKLVEAVQKAVSGGTYVGESLAEALAVRLGAATDRPLHETLSDREYDVMCMIASGKTVSRIARELALSVKTVSTYRARILDKMHMHTNADLTRYAIMNGLVQ